MSNAWGKLHGGLAFSRKWVPLSMAARGLWATALSYSIGMKTQGNLESHLVSFFGGTQEMADELVESGLWEVTPEGYQFHDWEDHQSSMTLTYARAEAARQNGAKGGRPRKTAGQNVSEVKPAEPDSAESKPTKTHENPKQTQKPSLELELEQELDNLTPHSPPTGGRSTYPEDFEEAWKAYPADGRKAKPKAAKAWAAATRSTPGPVILEAVRRYAVEVERTGHAVKWMQGWLNDGRYLDETALPGKVTPLSRDRFASSAYGLLQAHAELAR